MSQKKLEENIESILETVNFIKDTVVDIDERVEKIDERVEKVEQTQDSHTRQLTTIENDVKTGLDKRKQLEVRVHSVEKHLNIKPPMGTVSR